MRQTSEKVASSAVKAAYAAKIAGSSTRGVTLLAISCRTAYARLAIWD